LGSPDDLLPEKKLLNFGSPSTPEDDDSSTFVSNLEKKTDEVTMGIAHRAVQGTGRVMRMSKSSKRRQEFKYPGDQKKGGVIGMLGQ
jgi:hypothetical protein